MNIIRDKEFPKGWVLHVDENGVSIHQVVRTKVDGKPTDVHKFRYQFSTLGNAVRKMIRIVLSKEGRNYELPEYINAFESKMDSIMERLDI